MANHRSGLLWGSVGTSSHGRSFDHIWLLVDDGLCVCVLVGGQQESHRLLVFFLSLFLSFKIFISVCLGMGKKTCPHTLLANPLPSIKSTWSNKI